MSFIGQVVNINQTMYVPAHIIAEHIANMKFADEYSKIVAKEKKDEIRDIKKVEKYHGVDTNHEKDSEKERAKDTIGHIDLKG